MRCIVNEKANWGSGQRKAQQAQTFLNQQGFLSSLLVTQYGVHAKELATTAAAQGIDTVVVIGFQEPG